MLFNKSPDNLFSAIMNTLQGATMTLSISAYLGQMEITGLIKTFFCSFCAGVMLSLFLRVPAFGAWIAKLLRCKKPAAQFLVANIVVGAIMGVLMNFSMTFMMLGPVPAFPGAFLHTLGVSILVSVISSPIWVCVTQRIVGKVYENEN